MHDLDASLLNFIVEASTNMPSDIRRVIARWREREDASTLSGRAVGIISKNIDMARNQRAPICQDTGMLTFWVQAPRGTDQRYLTAAIHEAVATATRMGALRPNSVDSITGKNAGFNIGPGTPVIHYEQAESDTIEIMLLLKGGGCENQNEQYSLPCELPELGRADRDLEGVYKCLIHAVHQAQGHGCSAGFLGACIGSDRAEGYAEAKRQLLRDAEDINPDPRLADLEQRVMEHADALGIGAMGFGGRVTLLGCKIGALNRIPASFFVSIAYNCWAYRRIGVRLDPASGAIAEWMFRDEAPANLGDDPSRLPERSVKRITTPLDEATVRSLRVGDLALVTGVVHTGRDGLHKRLMTEAPPVPLTGGLIYHCGPVVIKDADGQWLVRSAGPTTSIREEPYQAEVLRRTGARAVAGKGGMGAQTLAALQEVGGVYLNAIGGAAAYYASAVTGVEGVDLLEELGVPEAMWHLRVVDFPAIVTMDAAGNSLHAEVLQRSRERLPETLSS